MGFMKWLGERLTDDTPVILFHYENDGHGNRSEHYVFGKEACSRALTKRDEKGIVRSRN